MASTTEVKIYSDQKQVVISLAEIIFKLLKLSTKDGFHILLSGGNTPLELFKRIAKEYGDSINWDQVHFWWGDERCVSPDSEESNYKQTNDYLISKINIPATNVHRIKGENAPDKEALNYSNEMKDFLNMRGDNPVFDVALLGLGDDGHTASIFPGELELFEDERICVVTSHPITGQNRITVTGRVLNNANRVFFMVTGANKAQRISEIMNDNEAAKLLPAYYISPTNGELIWFIDEEAARNIK